MNSFEKVTRSSACLAVTWARTLAIEIVQKTCSDEPFYSRWILLGRFSSADILRRPNNWQTLSKSRSCSGVALLLGSKRSPRSDFKQKAPMQEWGWKSSSMMVRSDSITRTLSRQHMTTWNCGVVALAHTWMASCAMAALCCAHRRLGDWGAHLRKNGHNDVTSIHKK